MIPDEHRNQLLSVLEDAANHKTRAELHGEIASLRTLLLRCERTLDMLLNPETIGGSTVLTAFSNCTETRSAIRSALAEERRT